VTLVGYGSVVGHVGAQAQNSGERQTGIRVDGIQAGGRSIGYQTFSVSFDNPGAITSIDIILVNATPGRALHIKDFRSTALP
jgi:hypothetical protein